MTTDLFVSIISLIAQYSIMKHIGLDSYLEALSSLTIITLNSFVPSLERVMKSLVLLSFLSH